MPGLGLFLTMDLGFRRQDGLVFSRHRRRVIGLGFHLMARFHQRVSLVFDSRSGSGPFMRRFAGRADRLGSHLGKPVAAVMLGLSLFAIRRNLVFGWLRPLLLCNVIGVRDAGDLELHFSKLASFITVLFDAKTMDLCTIHIGRPEDQRWRSFSYFWNLRYWELHHNWDIYAQCLLYLMVRHGVKAYR